MIDTRREAKRLWGKLEFSSRKALIKSIMCTIFAAIVALYPEWTGLSDAGRWSFFILLLGAGLWITEAVPSFAVAILIIALQIFILGKPGGVFADNSKDWEIFVRPWSSPLMWLFFSGFVLAEAAQVTGLDRIFSRYVLSWFGNRPGSVLFGIMSVTFIFSMFMSNTATTAMMIAVVFPIVRVLDRGDPFAKAILLGVAFAANIGGMGTIIGSPPNAIAAGALSNSNTIDFVGWMVVGIPPAILLFIIAWAYLYFSYPARIDKVNTTGLQQQTHTGSHLPMWKRLIVMPVFFMTIILWMSGSIHHIPTSVVSFFPVTIFAITGILTVKEIRNLHWDILLLLAGGLSLGIAVQETGLAEWLISSLPISAVGPFLVTCAMVFMVMILSNFMSNTAATNILVPIGLAIGVGFETQIVIPIALGASAAMCLPISTPPNAIAFGSSNLHTKDFIKGGLIIGFIAPILVTLWCHMIF